MEAALCLKTIFPNCYMETLDIVGRRRETIHRRSQMRWN